MVQLSLCNVKFSIRYKYSADCKHAIMTGWCNYVNYSVKISEKNVFVSFWIDLVYNSNQTCLRTAFFPSSACSSLAWSSRSSWAFSACMFTSSLSLPSSIIAAGLPTLLFESSVPRPCLPLLSWPSQAHEPLYINTWSLALNMHKMYHK